jgi:hypothetical protein
MRSGSHVQLAALRSGTLSYRQPRHSVIMDQWNGQVVMVQFLSIKFFFVGFLQFLLGFSKVPVFLCHPVLSESASMQPFLPLIS